MAFKRTENLHPDQLSQDTRYRFEEIELSKAIYILNQSIHKNNMYPTKAIETLIQMIANHLPEHHEMMRTIFNLFPFQFPTQEETVQYFRYKNLGIKKVYQYTKAPLKDLVQGGKYHYKPELKPMFPYWDHAQSALFAWGQIKHYFNLFDEPLFHTADPKEQALYTQDQPTQTPTPTTALSAEEETDRLIELAIASMHQPKPPEPYKYIPGPGEVYDDPMSWFDDEEEEEDKKEEQN